MKKYLLTIVFSMMGIYLFAETELEKLEKRIAALEQILFYVKTIGLPLLSLTSLWAVYMWWKGIKNKVNDLIDKNAKVKLDKKVSELIQTKLDKYPFIEEYNKKQAAKKGFILILSSRGKNDAFNTWLHKYGFTNLTNKKILELNNIDLDKFKIILFNDKDGDLTQSDMDEVVKAYNGQIRFLHYNTTNKRFDSKIKVQNILYANSDKTLDQRLTELLM